MSGNTERVVSLVINGKQAHTTMRELGLATKALSRDLMRMREVDDPKAYQAKVQALKRVNQTYREMRGEIYQTTTASQKFFANVKTIAAGVIGGNMITGFFTTLRSEIDRSVDVATRRADQLSDIQKTTGLVGESLDEVEKRINSIDTRTSREELRRLAWQAGKLGKQGVEDVASFVEQANIVNVALGEDLGADAMIAIGKAAKQLDVEILNLASGFNALGMASEAQEGFMLEFTSRLAPLGKTANITAAEILGFAGTIDAAGLNVEMSATALNKFFIDFEKNTDKFGQIAGFAAGELGELKREMGTNEAFLRMLEQLKALNPESEDFLQKLEELGIDGARGSQVFLSLSNNLEEVRRQQTIANEEIEKGTSILEEYFIKNNNTAAQHEKNKKALQSSLKPFRLFLAETTIGFTGWLAKNMAVIFSLVKVLLKAAIAWGTYKSVVLLATVNQKLFRVELINGIKTLRLQRSATLALATAKAVLSGSLTKLIQAFRLFSNSIKMHPVGLLISALSFAVSSIFLFKKQTDEATASQKEFNAAIEEGQNLLQSGLKLQEKVDVRKGLSLNQLEGLANDLKSEIDLIEKKATTVLALQEKAKKAERPGAQKAVASLGDAKSSGIPVSPEIAKMANLARLTTAEEIAKSKSENIAKEQEGANLRELNTLKAQHQERLKLVEEEIAAKSKSTKVTKTLTEEEKAAFAKKAEDQKAAHDKELEQLQEHLVKFRETMDSGRRDLELEAMDAETKEAARVDDKYEKVLADLDAFNTELMASENLTENEKAAMQLVYDQLVEEAMQLHYEELLKLADDFNEKSKLQKQENDLKLKVALMTDQEREIYEINKHYDELEALAAGNAERLKEIARLRAAALAGYADKEVAKTFEAAQAKAMAEARAAGEIANMMVAMAEFTADGTEKNSDFQKAAALASIAASTAQSIASAMQYSAANPANGLTAGMAGLAQFAAVSAAILSAMTQATKILTSSPTPVAPDYDTVPQFYGGGFTYATGASDGKQYKAVNYGSIANGGSVNSTGLGLLAEKGPEFVIPNSIYSNPSNAPLMQALNATMRTVGNTSATSGGVDSSEAVQLLKVIAANVNKPVRAATYFDQRSYEDYLELRNRAKNASRLNNRLN